MHSLKKNYTINYKWSWAAKLIMIDYWNVVKLTTSTVSLHYWTAQMPPGEWYVTSRIQYVTKKKHNIKLRVAGTWTTVSSVSQTHNCRNLGTKQTNAAQKRETAGLFCGSGIVAPAATALPATPGSIWALGWLQSRRELPPSLGFVLF